MTNAWTNVPKPTGTPYSFINPQGKEQYDQSLLYDDPNTFYDGVDMGAWTSVAKPIEQGIIVTVGKVQGLLMPLTTPSSTFTGTDWTKVSKPLT